MNILEEISKREIEEFNQRREFLSLLKKYGRIYPVISFSNALTPISIIGEFKPASPVKGTFIKDPKKEIRNFIDVYQNIGCKAISVLTNKRDFKGDPLYISYIKTFCNLPILYKNFILLEDQIEEAFLLGADCVLLIVSILGEKRLRDLYTFANKLGLDSLIEIHDERELQVALEIKPKIIGINNRNLKTFEVDINNTFRLSKAIPAEIKIVSESGIKSLEEIDRLLKYGISGALIGETMVNLVHKTDYLKLKNFLTNNKAKNAY
ncbi:MAG TPA: indole-3-glycerol-phosphate synthase [Thermodesulfobium narugense]|nr:MAG: indole-3-glycerol-phosphate synthase TrpC [Thermodesulfobium narugense]HEM56186.1 indole-3-glycerol-phosphate synthase [Thermodesulfobium narugense]